MTEVKMIINVIESPTRVAFHGPISKMGFSAFFFGDFLFGAAKKKVTRPRGRTPRLITSNTKKRLKIQEKINQKISIQNTENQGRTPGASIPIPAPLPAR
jgi:hypothetical protein